MKKPPRAFWTLIFVAILISVLYYFVFHFNNYSDTNITQQLLNDELKKAEKNRENSENQLKKLGSDYSKVDSVIQNLNSKNFYFDSLEIFNSLDEFLKKTEDYSEAEVYNRIDNIDRKQVLDYFSSWAIYINQTYDPTFDDSYSYDLFSKAFVLSFAPTVYDTDKKIKVDKNFIEKARLVYNKNNFEIRLKKLQSALRANKSELLIKKDDFSKIVDRNEHRIKDIKAELDELKNQNSTKIIVTIVLPIFGLILLLLYVVPIWWGDEDTRKNIFEKGILVQIITVFLLIGTILILGLANVIDKQVVGTLLGSISVYVLQKAVSDKSSGNSPNVTPVQLPSQVPPVLQNTQTQSQT